MTDKRDRYQIDATKETRSRINAIKAQLSLKTQDDVLVMLLELWDKRKTK
jgi:hypothetical protein